MQGLYGPRMCNQQAMKHWSEEFGGNLGIALTDTVTTDYFLKGFDAYHAKLFDGVRQDSGSPYECAEKVIAHYESLGIDPKSKVIVFSDSLDPSKAIALTAKFRDRINVTCGIGTNLTHDVGLPAMNHVIKMTDIDFTDGGENMTPVVKLSDTPEKASGDKAAVENAKYMIGLK
jgi:nicotinate phosphoribosyltransferase